MAAPSEFRGNSIMFKCFGRGLGAACGRLSLLACLALAGCASAVNSLSVDDVATFKLAAVKVTIAPDASIQWEDGVRAYAKAKALPDEGLALAASTPEAKAFILAALADKLKGTLERHLGGEFRGHRPVRLEVIVRNFVIANAVQKIIVGGGNSMKADATLVDAHTGAVLISHPDLVGFSLAGNGVVGTLVEAAIADNPSDRVMRSFAERYSDWLLKKS
jgi:hypothetical protein